VTSDRIHPLEIGRDRCGIGAQLFFFSFLVVILIVPWILGWVDEGIQWFLPNRVYDLVDVGLNAAFGLMAIVASLVVGLARKLDIRKRLGLRKG
jgi:VanZ family protein